VPPLELLKIVDPSSTTDSIRDIWEKPVVSLTVWRLVHRNDDTPIHGAFLVDAPAGITTTEETWTYNIAVFGSESGQGGVNFGQVLTESVVVFWRV
jgi:hypothetical protein